MLVAFIAFREEVILRRARFDLNKARERGHVLVGLVIAVANIDPVIALIRAAPDAATARAHLMERSWEAGEVVPLLALIHDDGNVVVDGQVRLTEAQARAILELRLARLTGLEREKIQADLDEVATKINELLEIIASRPRRLEVMRDELVAVRAEIAVPRATEISDIAGDQTDESLVEPGQMVVTITRDGFIKRTPLDIFRAQNRGGRGRTAAGRRGDDIITRSFNAHTHQWVLFFSSGGKAYREKVWRLPEASPTAKGRALVNLLPELGSDHITTVLPLPQDEEMWESLHLVFATLSGNVRRNRLSDFRNVRSSGLIAMKLDTDGQGGGDRLIGVATCREGQDVFLATRRGRCVRFQISDDTLRVFAGRDSSGVRGIRLGRGDEVNSLCVLNHVEADVAERSAFLRMANARRRLENAAEEVVAEPELSEDSAEEAAPPDASITPERFAELEGTEEVLLTVTDGGYGKRSSAYDYRVSGRGGSGIRNIVLAARNGSAVVATLPVLHGTDVMLVTDAGRLIRVPVDQVRVTARQSMGVTLFRMADGEQITSVFPVLEDPALEDEVSGDGVPGVVEVIGEDGAPESDQAPESDPAPERDPTDG